MVGITQEANTAPAFITSAAFSTNENQAATFQVTAMDPDDGDEVTYAITGGADQAKFDIDASSGVLTFKDAPDHENPTDADSNNVYLVTVTATGGTGARALTADQAITVTVTAVDEIWSATMTVGVNTTLLGWDDAGNYIGSALSDEDFDYGGDTYNLSVIRLASGSLIVIFNDAGDLATAATRDKLTLHVGATTFNFGAGALNAAQTGVAWSAGLTWSDGDTVELKITVSEDAEVALTSDPGEDDTYAIGDAIEATATFGQAVTVTGTPQIEMQVGGETRTADYASGSGSTNLVFSYTVVEGDLDADGVAVELGLIDLNGGTILVGTTAAGLIHGAVSASTDHKVDGVRPIFVSAETNEAGTRLVCSRSASPLARPTSTPLGCLARASVSVTLIEIDGAVVELDPAVDFAHDTMWRIDFAPDPLCGTWPAMLNASVKQQSHHQQRAGRVRDAADGPALERLPDGGGNQLRRLGTGSKAALLPWARSSLAPSTSARPPTPSLHLFDNDPQLAAPMSRSTLSTCNFRRQMPAT